MDTFYNFTLAKRLDWGDVTLSIRPLARCFLAKCLNPFERLYILTTDVGAMFYCAQKLSQQTGPAKWPMVGQLSLLQAILLDIDRTHMKLHQVLVKSHGAWQTLSSLCSTLIPILPLFCFRSPNTQGRQRLALAFTSEYRRQRTQLGLGQDWWLLLLRDCNDSCRTEWKSTSSKDRAITTHDAIALVPE
jgi:hypothetical protein